MQHLAIDLGGRESVFCVRNQDGVIAEEGRVPTHALGTFLAKRLPCRVILETCAEAFAVADSSVAAGHDTRVVPSRVVRALGVGDRRLKTDQRDAQALSEASSRSELPSVHIRSSVSRELQALHRTREELVECRTKLINGVRGWLRTRLIRIPSGNPCTFPKRVREAALATPHGVPSYLERNLVVIAQLTEHIDAANQEMKELVAESELCGRLKTVPCVGAVTALRYMSVVDDVRRFKSAHRVESYLGITPGENSSSGRKQRLAITKAGPGDLRGLLLQVAWSAWRTRPDDPMVRWARKVAERRGRKIALVALSRRIAGVMYAVWRDGTTYDPKRTHASVAER
jgi:transposase